MSIENSWYDFPQVSIRTAMVVERGGIRSMVMRARRVAILSAPLAFPGFLALAVRASPSVVREIIAAAMRFGVPVECYHGHQAILNAVSKIIGISLQGSSASYELDDGDVVIAVRLRRRLETPEDVEDLQPEDVEFVVVQYVKISV